MTEVFICAGIMLSFILLFKYIVPFLDLFSNVVIQRVDSLIKARTRAGIISVCWPSC